MNKRQRKKFKLKHNQKTFYTKLKKAKTMNEFLNIYYHESLMMRAIRLYNNLLKQNANRQT